MYFTVVNITEKPYDIAPRENIRTQTVLKISTDKQKRKQPNFHWVQHRALTQRTDVPLVANLQCADKPQNKFLTSTLLSHTCSRAHSRKWLPPIFDMTTIQWVTIMKLTWVKRLRGIFIVSRHARPRARSAFWASFNTVYSWKLTLCWDVCERPPLS